MLVAAAIALLQGCPDAPAIQEAPVVIDVNPAAQTVASDWAGGGQIVLDVEGAPHLRQIGFLCEAELGHVEFSDVYSFRGCATPTAIDVYLVPYDLGWDPDQHPDWELEDHPCGDLTTYQPLEDFVIDDEWPRAEGTLFTDVEEKRSCKPNTAEPVFIDLKR